MAEIGREGGQSVSGDRAHMAEIGREGGHRRQTQRHEAQSSRPEDAEREEREEISPYGEPDHHAPH
jgi:general stress protein YciG